MGTRMRILTFNWHEAYICTLAKTGHQFDIVERQKGGSAVWFYETRPVPANARIVRESTARRNLRAGAYDVMLCHNVADLSWSLGYDVGRVLVLHNRLTTELALGGNTVDRAKYRAELDALIASVPGLRIVCISASKRDDWAIDADVILPGIDLSDYGGYRGEQARVLRVGNFMKARDVMLGYTDQLAILDGAPSTLLGLNDPEEGAEVRFSRSWDDLREAFRSHRLFLNTTVDGFEDGYNLAMLEAMATGMPVVTTPNASSPIVDGVNGFVSADRAVLASRVRELLADRELAERLGAAARRTVAERFSMTAFVENWNRVFQAVTAGRAADSTAAARGPIVVTRPAATGASTAPRELTTPARRRVLLSYVAYPATTARYYEDSLRRAHEVVTVGPAMSEGLRRHWNLERLAEPTRPHDVPVPPEADMRPIVDRLSARWQPELFLWIESVFGHRPQGLRSLGIPTACYLIDSHLQLPWHLEWATQFDYVFVAQREYIPHFLEAGVTRVAWLPLACDPMMHGPVPGPKQFDVGFVGSLTEHHAVRRARLERLRTRFNVHVERAFLRDMAAILSRSRLVFNDAVKRDLNMRVFEALCTGSCLLTDRATPSGLDELFVDREHLVIYDDDDLEDLVEYYLAHEDEREAIAAAGRAEVLRRHTYDHRVASLLDTVFASASEAASSPIARWIQDPLVREAGRALGEGAIDTVLARLQDLGAERELSSWERCTAHQLAATALGARGEVESARARHLEALAALNAEQRQFLRSCSV